MLLWLIFHKASVARRTDLHAVHFHPHHGPLQDLGNIILAYREAEASLQLFDELMRKKPEYRPEEPVEIGEIERLRFDRVSFRYKGGTQDAVVNLSFRVPLRRDHRLRRAFGLGQVDAGQIAGGIVRADPGHDIL